MCANVLLKELNIFKQERNVYWLPVGFPGPGPQMNWQTAVAVPPLSPFLLLKSPVGPLSIRWEGPRFGVLVLCMCVCLSSSFLGHGPSTGGQCSVQAFQEAQIPFQTLVTPGQQEGVWKL